MSAKTPGKQAAQSSEQRDSDGRRPDDLSSRQRRLEESRIYSDIHLFIPPTTSHLHISSTCPPSSTTFSAARLARTTYVSSLSMPRTCSTAQLQIQEGGRERAIYGAEPSQDKRMSANSNCHTQLAFGILSALAGGIVYATSGPKKVAGATPAINASSKEEENFVQYVK